LGIELATKLGWIENAWNHSSRTPRPHLNPFYSARANKHLPAMRVADSPMVVTLPGLRRKAGLKQSLYDGLNYGRVYFSNFIKPKR
jgi:hypothetical protein